MFSWLAYNTLCALPLVLVAWAVRRVPRATPALQHFLWLLVLVRLVWPPLERVYSAAGAAPTSGPPVTASLPTFGDTLVALTSRVLGNNWSGWVFQVMVVGYLGLFATVLLREVRRARAVERCVRAARPAPDVLARRVNRMARSFGIREPAVSLSPLAAGPFLWSLRRPVLVLPDAERVPDRTVLAHELAHLTRRDHWVAWFELLVQAFHFWNPLFWIARRQLHRAAELACDHWVVRRYPSERRDFASALIDTAERASGAFVPRAVQAIGMDARDFEERLEHILRHESPPRAPRLVVALGALVAFGSLPGVVAPTLDEYRAALPAIPDGVDRGIIERALAEAEAAQALQPDNGAVAMRRGVALLGLGRFQEAAEAFQHQEDLGYAVAKARYNRACAWAQLGERDEAVACLLAAAQAGLDVLGYVALDEDLVMLRGDPRLEALATRP